MKLIFKKKSCKWLNFKQVIVIHVNENLGNEKGSWKLVIPRPLIAFFRCSASAVGENPGVGKMVGLYFSPFGS